MGYKDPDATGRMRQIVVACAGNTVFWEEMMRFVVLALALCALAGCAEKSGSKSFIGIDAYQEESRSWKQGEDGDMRFGRYSTHRYAATQHGVDYTPVTTPYGKTYY